MCSNNFHSKCIYFPKNVRSNFLFASGNDPLPKCCVSATFVCSRLISICYFFIKFSTNFHPHTFISFNSGIIFLFKQTHFSSVHWYILLSLSEASAFASEMCMKIDGKKKEKKKKKKDYTEGIRIESETVNGK